MLESARWCAGCDRLATRNAELIRSVKGMAEQYHKAQPDHPVGVSWFRCPHPYCQRVAKLTGVAKVGE